jgi:hypothetical protein
MKSYKKFDNMDDEKHYMDEDIDDMNEIVFMDGIDHMNMVLIVWVNFTWTKLNSSTDIIMFTISGSITLMHNLKALKSHFN